MNFNECFYFSTVAFCASIPIVYCTHIRRPICTGSVFSIFFFIYSFIAPLALIFRSTIDEYTGAHHVWDEIVPLYDFNEIRWAHIYYVTFFLAWWAGYVWGRHAETRVIKRLQREPAILFPNVSLVFAVMLGLIFLVLIWQKFGPVLRSGISVYAAKATRDAAYQLSTLDKAAFSLWGGAILSYAVSKFSEHKNGAPSLWSMKGVTILAVAYIAAGFIIGDRSQMIVPLIAAIIAYDRLVAKITFTVKTFFIISSLITVNFIVKSLRGENLQELSAILSSEERFNPTVVVSAVVLSVESFAAYAAMPFFVISNLGGSLLGKSFAYLAVSILPRSVAPFRPVGTFSYGQYAEMANLVGSDRGYTMHFAADCYLNFGCVGVIVGGAVMGWLMGRLEKKSLQGRWFWLAAHCMILGAIPYHLRSTIEGLKSVIFEWWPVPFFVFILIPMFYDWTKWRLNGGLMKGRLA